MCDKYIIGFWISERKRQKLNWDEVEDVFYSQGLLMKTIDIDSNLESQEPFHVFLHKLTDTLAHAENGDSNASCIIARVQDYISTNPELIVIDPLKNVRKLCNRYKSYDTIREGVKLNDVFMPNFVELRSTDVDENVSLLKKNRISFPFLCKPLIAHGSSDAHKMMIIFSEKGVKNCQTPCVAQDFINHNAILYKVFIVGEYFHVVERPSFRNFYADDCASMDTIFFSSHDISKSGAKSKWSILLEKDIPTTVKPNYNTLEEIVQKITRICGLTLMGVDVVIENHTGKYAIIDVNVFPGYDGYPNFSQHLVYTIKKLLTESYGNCKENANENGLKKCHSTDVDSGFESDEKRKLKS